MSDPYSQFSTALGALEELARHHPERDVDEYALARYLAIVPENMPAHHYIKSSQRGKFLRVLAALEAQQFIYVTHNGFWRLHMTRLGKQWLDDLDARPECDELSEHHEVPPSEPCTPARAMKEVWHGPRPSQVPPRTPSDRFTTAALGAATLAAVIIFAFGILPQGPLAQKAAAKPDTSVAVTMQVVPTVPPAVATAAPATTPTPSPRAYVVANTGGAGVLLRNAPKSGAAVTALPDNSKLVEVSPPATVNGAQWLHVRTATGTEGFVSAAYTVPAR